MPAHDLGTFGTFEAIEIARELATLLMIATVGWLAGRTSLERLAWASVVFGAWDIVCYVGLRAIIGWPPAFDAWDVLFLVPVPWVAPVWAPIVVSTALIIVGLAAARRLRAGREIRVGWVRALMGLGGGGLVITSFVVDAGRVLGGDAGGWAAWPLFWAGIALAAGGALAALREPAPDGSRSGALFRDERTAGAWPANRTSKPLERYEVIEMADTVKDPVCGMEIRPEDAVATEIHDGQTFYFCSQACHDTFAKDPPRYGHPAPGDAGQAEHAHH